MIKRLFLFFSILCMFSMSLLASDASRRVANIDIIMHDISSSDYDSFDEEVMYKRIKTQENTPFSQLIFNEDLKNLSSEYEKVESDIQYLKDGVHIRLDIWPKPIIEKIYWEGNENITVKKLKREFDVKEGDIFDIEDFNDDVFELKKFLLKEGYFESDIEYKIFRIPETNKVDITIKIHEGHVGKISGISIFGVGKEERKEICDLMITKKYNFLISWITHEGIISKELLERDEFTLTYFFQNRGYADAQVTIKVLENPEKSNRVIVKVFIDKGAKYHFRNVSFSGNTLFTNRQIKDVLTIRNRESYSPENIRNSARNIMNLYGTKGYIESNVDINVRIIDDNNEYDVDFVIEEGEQYRVGMIKTFGNTTTKQSVILHETLVVPGEVFNINKLDSTEERIRNIGYFEDVNVYTTRTNDKELGNNFRDVHIDVTETKTASTKFFVGISSGKSVNGGIELTELNFNYKGLPRIFEDGIYAVRGGGEAARLRFSVSEKEQSCLLSWTKPYFLDTPWIIGFDVEREINRMQARDYEIKSLGGGLYAGYDINDFLRFGWHYRLRNGQIKITGNVTDIMREEARNNGIVSASGVSLNYDSTDHPLAPTKGLKSQLKTEYAGLGGRFHFWSLGYTNSLYYSLWKDGTFKYRFDLNFLTPLGSTTYETIPLGERLYLGGDGSVRGYRSYMLGPKFSSGDPRGGLSTALGSFEYQHRFTPRFSLFAFTDTGIISEKKFHINVNNFRFTAGVGARLSIINNIPITLGLGFPIGKYTSSDINRFFFSIGGNF